MGGDCCWRPSSSTFTSPPTTTPAAALAVHIIWLPRRWWTWPTAPAAGTSLPGAVTSAADALKPDMTANISIKTAELQALVVPTAAVQREGEQRLVYITEAGRHTQRPVSLGVRGTEVT